MDNPELAKEIRETRDSLTAILWATASLLVEARQAIQGETPNEELAMKIAWQRVQEAAQHLRLGEKGRGTPPEGGASQS
jgi:hypothetical protein